MPHEITSHFDSGNPSNHFSCLLPSDFQVSASFSFPTSSFLFSSCQGWQCGLVRSWILLLPAAAAAWVPALSDSSTGYPGSLLVGERELRHLPRGAVVKYP